jgi:hypothetical protein
MAFDSTNPDFPASKGSARYSRFLHILQGGRRHFPFEAEPCPQAWRAYKEGGGSFPDLRGTCILSKAYYAAWLADNKKGDVPALANAGTSPFWWFQSMSVQDPFNAFWYSSQEADPSS